jgi:hypothetical protein
MSASASAPASHSRSADARPSATHARSKIAIATSTRALTSADAVHVAPASARSAPPIPTQCAPSGIPSARADALGEPRGGVARKRVWVEEERAAAGRSPERASALVLVRHVPDAHARPGADHLADLLRARAPPKLARADVPQPRAPVRIHKHKTIAAHVHARERRARARHYVLAARPSARRERGGRYVQGKRVEREHADGPVSGDAQRAALQAPRVHFHNARERRRERRPARAHRERPVCASAPAPAPSQQQTHTGSHTSTPPSSAPPSNTPPARWRCPIAPPAGTSLRCSSPPRRISSSEPARTCPSAPPSSTRAGPSASSAVMVFSEGGGGAQSTAPRGSSVSAPPGPLASAAVRLRSAQRAPGRAGVGCASARVGPGSTV